MKKTFDLTVYLVTDRLQYEPDQFLYMIDEACCGGVTLIQLREKEAGGLTYLSYAEAVKEIADRHRIPLIIDDRIDVAMAVDAAGVHVGQSDIPVYTARKLLGPDKIIGATVKTVEQAKKAVEQGADYLGVGAVYPTATKVKTVLTPVKTLNDICREVSVPVVAIGGLHAGNIHVLKNSRISGVAVVSAIMKAEQPKEAAAALKNTVCQMRGYQQRK